LKFNKHDSFYVRQSWPAKAASAINTDNTIFSPQNEQNAVDELGLGRVMVKSLRYWSRTLGISTESKDSNGLIIHELTPTARIIFNHDRFFQRTGSRWLLHFNLANARDEATTWYWFFNEFNYQRFTAEQFMEQIKNYVIHHEIDIAVSSLQRDFNCLRQSYLRTSITDIEYFLEEGILSYFAPLGILEEKGQYLLKQSSADSLLPPEILYYCILADKPNEIRQLSIEDIFEAPKSSGKVFNLNYNALLNKLDVLENMGYIEVFKRFGYSHIEIKQNNHEDILLKYFRKEY
jgi:hypothetical protein